MAGFILSRMSVLELLYCFFKVQLSPLRIIYLLFFFFVVCLFWFFFFNFSFCFSSYPEDYQGIVSLWLSSPSKASSRSYVFGHTEGVTSPSSQPLLGRQEAAPVQTLCRVAKAPVCAGFPSKSKAAPVSAKVCIS